MKHSLFFGFVSCFFLIQSPSFAQTSDSSDLLDQEPVTQTTPPYIRQMERKALLEMKKIMNQDKEKIMESLNKAHHYTEDEYQTLYQNYDINPPFIEQEGQLVLNPDYVSKNTKYVEKDGKLVLNENYQPDPTQEKFDITKIVTVPKEAKKLGKKSYHINPDAFY